MKKILCWALLAAPAALDAQEFVPVNLYVADLKETESAVVVGAPRKLTGDRSISSQPAFTPDGRSLLFIGRRDSANAQSDVYRIDLATGAETRVTSTPEMENSPTVTPDGRLMVIRWVPETLFKEWGPWIYTMQGQAVAGVLPGPDTVGYYVRIDSVTFAMVRPKSASTVAIFNVRDRTMTDRDGPVANLPPQLVPRRRAITYTRPDSLGSNEIRMLDLDTGDTTVVTAAVRGRVAHAWTPRGTLLMGKGNAVYARKPGRDTAWRRVASFADPELQSVTTYVVSPQGDKVILLSPVKPSLHVVLRDSLQAGKNIAETLTQFASWSADEIRARYEVSRAALTALATEYRRRSTPGIEELDRFLGGLLPPAPPSP